MLIKDYFPISTRILTKLSAKEVVVHSSNDFGWRSGYDWKHVRCIISVLTPTDITADDARQVCKDSGIKNVDWAPHGIAVWEPFLKYHVLIQFPMQLWSSKDRECDVSFQNVTQFWLPSGYGYLSIIDLTKNNQPELKVTIGAKYTEIEGNNYLVRYPVPMLDGQTNSLVSEQEPFAVWAARHAPYLYVLASELNMRAYQKSPTLKDTRGRVTTLTDGEKSLIATEKVPVELFKDTLLSVLSKSQSGDFFMNLHDLGMLKGLVPELYEAIGCLQDPKYHTDDVFTHSIKALNAADQYTYNPITKLAILFHDIGKARTRKEYVTGGQG